MSRLSSAARLVVWTPGVLVIVAATTLLGPQWIGWDEIFSREPSYVYWHLRMPRALLAACAGAGLAVGGVVFQALFRNPLASPSVLGTTAGASFGGQVA